MSDEGRPLTRRDFLRGTATAALAGVVAPRIAASGTAPGPTGAAVAGTARVVLVRDEVVLRPGGTVDAAVLRTMLDRGACALARTESPSAAFRSWFSPADTVGVKSNSWRFLPTPPEMEEAIRERLLEAGVRRDRIAVDDRGVLRNPVFGRATALVNVRPMRTHHWAGVGSLIKNYIMFVEEPSAWHGDSCADLAGIWKLPAVAGKTRLNVLVMLTPLYHSVGPHDFQPKYVWPYRGILLGTDPVAVDATGLRIIEAKRRAHFGADEPLAVPPKHIRVAAERHGLGIADPARIDLQRIGWAEGALI